MCSSIVGPIIVDNYQRHLTDIVRANGGAYGSSSCTSCSELRTTFYHHTVTHTLSHSDKWHRHFSSSPSSSDSISPNAKLPVSPNDSITAMAPSPTAIKPPAVA
ncbi:hypothetical protein PHAVU_006G123200 [Phaseolus vulgaris]|uniref:Uncharacterized protein n=1 Tax=Phaseolus vulgaris TaxID=3885 RepID=V7BS66_PHAVU|nr:hypothetical protein PHAVU_006G123200g [Phaseolus vulgaris]ESW19416.1 hypothetical protein PHAVU_006G123200g [Phaseolus vulgaris]